MEWLPYNPLMARTMLFLSLLSIAACGGEPEAPRAATPHAAAPSKVDVVSAPEDSASPAIRVVVLGDSLAAGFGLAEEEAFPAIVERELRARGWRVNIVNAGVSGDTTAGGKARLPWLLRQQPEIVVLELGANDALRGLPVDAAAENLAESIRLARESGARVLLAGMKVPPNYGPDYSSSFEAIYPRLASDFEVALMPFLLEGVGGRPELNLADGIHPNAEGHGLIAERLLPHLEALLEGIERTAGTASVEARRSGA